jgi:hypothetical protein
VSWLQVVEAKMSPFRRVKLMNPGIHFIEDLLDFGDNLPQRSIVRLEGVLRRVVA